jgi:hypothetical protein
MRNVTVTILSKSVTVKVKAVAAIKSHTAVTLPQKAPASLLRAPNSVENFNRDPEGDEPGPQYHAHQFPIGIIKKRGCRNRQNQRQKPDCHEAR